MMMDTMHSMKQCCHTGRHIQACYTACCTSFGTASCRAELHVPTCVLKLSTSESAQGENTVNLALTTDGTGDCM